MKRNFLLLFLFLPICLWAKDVDFGVDLIQNAGFGGTVDKIAQELGKGFEVDIDYTGSLVPHFSTPIGSSGELYFSLGLTATYEFEKFIFVPELLHTEFSWRSGNIKFRLGRLPYSDPLDFIAEGFFDGAQIFYDSALGALSVGAWYTGLLYKRTANITMPNDDQGSLFEPFDYGDFYNTYFASKRVLLSLGWENSSFMEVIRIRAAMTGQIDLNDTNYLYNSAYMSGKAYLPFKPFLLIAGLCMEISNYMNETGTAFAWELGAGWSPPTPFASQLSLTWRYSTGRSENFQPFIPITTKPQGDVFEAKLSGLMAFFLDYTAQFRPNLSASLVNSYFIRTDYGTYSYYPAIGNTTEYYLGTEIFGRFDWKPLSDLTLNLGAGVFLPYSAFDADPSWRVELGLALILY